MYGGICGTMGYSVDVPVSEDSRIGRYMVCTVCVCIRSIECMKEIHIEGFFSE